MQVLAEEANRLEELVESILSLSRLQAAPTIQLFRPEMLDLHQLAADVVQNQQARTESQHIHLQMSDASQRVRIRVDRSQITQLVTNLVTNAVNYTPAGGRVNVSVSRFEDETGQGWARLAVQDTGIGIPESEQDRLFDRFYRGSQTRDSDIPGTGLGLSIAQEVVEQHNGKISVTSQVGNGSTFQVDLPLHTAQPNKKQPPSSQPVPPALVQKV